MTPAGSSSRPGPERRGVAAVAVWAAALAAGLLYLALHGRLETGLAGLLPEERVAEAALLKTALERGSVPRSLLVAVSGGTPAARETATWRLAEALRREAGVVSVTRAGEGDPALLEPVLDYRYLLSPAVEESRFTVSALERALAASLPLLTVPDPGTETLVRRDPTGAMAALVERWRSAAATPDTPDETAVLIVEGRAGGDDLDAQAALLERVGRVFEALEAGRDLTLTVTGNPVFAVDTRETIRGEVNRLATVVTLLVAGILILLFRRARPVLLAGLPLATGLVAGGCAVMLLDGSLHGLTLAFGATLLGVAIDYPLHVLAHGGGRPAETAARLWPLLATGALTTTVGFLAFLLSDFRALAQLGAFGAAGLLAALATARYALPPLAGGLALRPPGAPWARLQGAPSPWWPGALVLVAGLALLAAAPSTLPLWQDDPAALSPLDPDLVERDARLRADAAAAQAGRFLLVSGKDAEQVLQAQEDLRPLLAAAVEAGTLQRFVLAADFLPSRRTQAARRQALPDPGELRRRLEQAVADLPYRVSAFEPFVEDVARSRTLAPLEPAGLPAGPWRARLDSLLTEADGRWIALVPLGAGDMDALQARLAAYAGPVQLRLVDLREATTQTFRALRREATLHLGIGLAAGTLLLAAALRDGRRLARVLLPVGAALAATAAALRLSGHPLSLFHVAALLLVAGIAVDYGIFLSSRYTAGPEGRRILRAVSVCFATSLGAFGALATSSLALLREIGVTVLIGLCLAYVLSMLGARRRGGDSEGGGSAPIHGVRADLGPGQHRGAAGGRPARGT